MRVAALILALLLGLLAEGAAAQEQPARPDLGASALVRTGRGWWGRPPPLELRLTLDRAVPYRAYLVADPARLIVDLEGVDFSGLDAADLFGADNVPAIRWGRFRRGWGRIVVELPGPYRIEKAGQDTRRPAPEIRVSLSPVKEADFAPRPSATTAMQNLPPPVKQDAMPPKPALKVVLDPGHGSFDPGAEAGGETEADLVLTFGQELRDALEERGIEVVMTREDDIFVRLDNRPTIARTEAADLFISLHADALPEGQAAGATIYVWNPASNARAASQLTLRHDRDDLLTGVDLSGQDDALAAAMMDFARTDIQPRSQDFARWLASRMALMAIGLHADPVQGAAFSVLKSPDIPSVLLELGFISDSTDRANLTDPAWRAGMVRALAQAVQGWARDQATRAPMLRQ